MDRFIVKNTTNVDVGANEMISRFAVNRGVGRLFENDKALRAFYESVFDGLSVSEYAAGRKYAVGDIVWFLDADRMLWLIRCVVDDPGSPQNAISDTAAYVYGHPDFEKYGWENQYEKANIQSMGLDARVRSVVGQLFEQHEQDPDCHPFGAIAAQDADERLLKRDMSNLLSNRKTIFFPYVSGVFQTDSVTTGKYRIYDNGLLEMDLTFRLGWTGETDKAGRQIIKCNDLALQTSASATSAGMKYQENLKYFNSIQDMQIFKGEWNGKSVIGDTLQTNRNDWVNVYSAKLEWPALQFGGQYVTGFSDVEYAVFGCGAATEVDASDPGNIVTYTGRNQMAFTDKTRRSITAVLVTYNQNGADDFANKCGIAANSFTCQLVGKWK